MKCTHVQVGEGAGAVQAIVCGRRDRPQPCAVCRKPSTKLCDWPTPDGETCDKPLCAGCARHEQPDLDFCPDHVQVPDEQPAPIDTHAAEPDLVFAQPELVKLTACAKCEAAGRAGKRFGSGPHSPHWGTALCGHMALVDCTNEPIEPCGLCAQKPWPSSAVEHVELREAGTGLTLVCRRCGSATGITFGAVAELLERFEDQHLFCAEET